MEARLEVIIGGMFSGKSTELVNRLKRYDIAGRDVLLFKPSIDNRYSEEDVVTHSGLSHPAAVVPDLTGLWDILVNRDQYPEVIGIDEAQFFDPYLSEVVHELIRDFKITVIVAGLDTDFRNEPWPTMVPLVFQAERVTKLNAVCTASKCGADASRTQRLVDGEPVTHGDSVLVGGKEAYEARCRHCYHEG